MADVSIGALGHLVRLLESAVPQLGGWPVYAYLRHDRWDFWRPWVEQPAPVVEVVVDAEERRVQMHLGGKFSPARAAEPPLRYAPFVSALADAARLSPPVSLFAAGVIRLPVEGEDEEYQYTLNVPMHSLALRPAGRSGRVELTFFCYATRRRV